MDLHLSGRAYFVSGLSRGIGQAIATALLDEGALVAGCARHEDGLTQLRQHLPDDSLNRLLTTVADVTDPGPLASAVIGASEIFGRLDGVVANAGAGFRAGVLETSDQEWDEQFRTKLHSVLNLVRPALPALRHSDAPRIVVMNGIIARQPDPHLAAASAARAGVANLTRSLAIELASESILVNSVNLGAIATSRQHTLHQDSGSPLDFDAWSQAEALRRGILLGRFGDPAEVVPAVLLLLSPLSSYITGSSIDISGGSGTTS